MSVFAEPVIVGVRPIGDHVGVNYVQAFRMLAAGTLPGELVARRWISRVSELDAWTAAQTTSPRRYGKRATA